MQLSKSINKKELVKLIKRYPLFTFFILTFFISWGSIFVVIGSEGIMGTVEISENLMPFLYLATLLGPSIAAILLTGFVDGKLGFKDLSTRLFRWRIDARWYAIILLTAPILILAILFGLSTISLSFLPAIFSVEDKLELLLTGIVMGLLVGFMEELGWTGFAVPKLRQRYSVFKTGLIVGFLWGLWHLPLFLGIANSSRELSTLFYLCVLLFSFLPAYRVLMLWVYEHTESLLIVILMHMPLAASQLTLIPSDLSGWQVVVYDLVFAFLLWIIILVIAVANDWKLEGKNN